ncbi:hypothetical protein B0J17DRAFT_771207 [Rhizoctonia solani]|nr:hypothetical protein B0J17DRAFT_771207 [Rhizoctonia solani]
MIPRSTTGCYTCKRRKKKCDEAKPHCLRCIRSRRECEGYAPLENPDSRGVMRRAKARPIGGILSPPQLNAADSREHQFSSNSPASTNISDQQRSSSTSLVSQWSSTENPVTLLPPETIWHPNATVPVSLSLMEQLPIGRPMSPLAPLDSHASSGTFLPYVPHSGDYLTDRYVQDVMPFETRQWPNVNLLGRCQPTIPDLLYDLMPEVKEGDDSEDDLEDAKEEMCIVPVLDPSTPENTLPFILQCYARWMRLVLFEPSRGAHPMKDNIVNKFMHSPGERYRIILLANAMGSLGKSIQPNPTAATLVVYLSTEAHQNLNRFISEKPASDREVDRQNALDTLNLLMEAILIQRYFHSLCTITKFIEAAAPVFRRACPEPVDQYVNFPRAIMSSDVNIRNFATSDIILSVTTGRPMLFRYDMTCPPDILMLINDGRYGMQWVHGIPDQYMIMLARINVLSEELGLGATVSSHCVAEIEKQIREVEVWTYDSAHPVSMIWKYTVRECWRLAMHLYLYMVLCQTRTDDARVLTSVESYVRLIEAVKSGRKPDAFLYIPTIIVGASAYKKQHRAILQRRMLGLQECINPGSIGYDALNILVDLWTRTDAENRPAHWSDFRMSTFWVSGV